MVNCIPFLDATTFRRVENVYNFCKNELIRRLQASEHGLTIQINETTDIARSAILLGIVRYIHETVALEDMLICKSLLTRTSVEEIFNLIDSYLKRIICLGIYDIEYVPMEPRQCSMNKRCCWTHQTKNLHLRSTHCCLHRQDLKVKNISEELKDVLNDCVKIINFIKS